MNVDDILKKLPNCRLVSTIDQSEDEDAWLAVRQKGIGGSDIGAISGVSPFSSAKQVYFNKTGMYQDELKPNDAAKERMHFGHMLEPVVAEEYARRTGAQLINLNCTVCHKDYPWARANVDRLIVKIDDVDGIEIITPIGVLECKTTGEYNNDDWDNGDILLSYIYQLNWYLWILGLEKGAFACLVGGNKFYEYEVFRNDDLIAQMFDTANNFWHVNVLGLVEPEMQSTDDELVKVMYADVTKGAEVIFNEEDEELVELLVGVKNQLKELESTKTELENRIKDRIGNNEIAKMSNYVVKWSPRTQRRVDTNILKTNFPDIYDQCTYNCNFRVLTTKEV